MNPPAFFPVQSPIASAAPIEGVTVEATGGYTTLTDAAGHYELTVVAGTYTVDRL